MADPRELHEALLRAITEAESLTWTPEQVEQTIQRAFAARRRRRIRTIVLLTVFLAGCTAAAAYWMRDVTTPATVVCFDDIDVNSNRAGVDVESSPSASDCVPVWESGQFTDSGIPPLIDCVSPDGTLWVFPSSTPDTCETLGLARPNPVSDDHPAFRVRAATRDVLGPCDPIAESVDAVRAALDADGLKDWDVQVQPNLPGRCATIAIEDENQLVWIVPINRRN